MTKIRLLCAKSDLEAVTDSLYEFGAIHVTRSKAFDTGTPLARLETVSPMLVKLRGVEDALQNSPAIGKNKALQAKLRAQAQAQARSQAESGGLEFDGKKIGGLRDEFFALKIEEYDALVKEKQAIEGELVAARSRENELAPFKKLALNSRKLETATQTNLLAALFFEASEANANEILKKIKQFGEALAFDSASGKPKVLAVVPRKSVDELRAAIGRVGREITPPKIPDDSTFDREHAAASARLAEAEARLQANSRALAAFAEKRLTRISALRKAFETEFRKADAAASFGQTKLAACVEGWISAQAFERLQNRLGEKFKQRVFIEKIDSGEEVPPSKLRNPVTAKPFELLTEFFSMPRYNEIDPTLLTSLTYPFFFGMILGDVGYGAILMIIGLALRFKLGENNLFLRRLGGVVAASGFATMVFGFVFAEAFGAEELLGFKLHPLISRVEENGINLLIAAAILVGYLHLSLGLALGAWEEFKEKYWRHGFAKVAWICVLTGLAAFATNAMGDLAFVKLLFFLNVFAPPFDLALLGAGVLGIIVFEGPVQVFEIPGILSNLLSYLRIMALGLSGVAIAGMVAKIPIDLNALASFDAAAMVTAFAMIFLVVLGHAMAVALGLMEAGIQSLRLHYVEFYSKFYKGGGVAFKPFRESE
jgi:V/A-type H+-transporting ATPase subunit I